MCDPSLRVIAGPPAIDQIDRLLDELFALHPHIPATIRFRLRLAVDDLLTREMPHELDESGRGIPLAREVLSLLEYRRTNGVNVWTLVSEPF